MKNNNLQIKRVIRKGVLETNSSSSHSLVISDDNDMIHRGDADCNLEIRNNVLYVNDPEYDFGWEYRKFNDCLTKLQYACGLLYPACENYDEDDTIISYKKIKAFKNKLKKYLEVDDVIFEWDEKFLNERMSYKALESLESAEDKDSYQERLYISYPTIDHQSLDGYFQVFETVNSLIHFIFSRDSWVYCGNDNSSEPENYRHEVKDYSDSTDFIVHFDFSESKSSIKGVDFELRHGGLLGFLRGNLSGISDNRTSRAARTFGLQLSIRDFYWDTETESICIENIPIYPRLEYKYTNVTSNDDQLRHSKKSDTKTDGRLAPAFVYQEDDGKIYIVFVTFDLDGENMPGKITGSLKNNGLMHLTLMAAVTPKNPFPWRDSGQEIYDNLKKSYIYGKDYLRFPIEIMSKEFGKLEVGGNY